MGVVIRALGRDRRGVASTGLIRRGGLGGVEAPARIASRLTPGSVGARFTAGFDAPVSVVLRFGSPSTFDAGLSAAIGAVTGAGGRISFVVVAGTEAEGEDDCTGDVDMLGTRGARGSPSAR